MATYNNQYYTLADLQARKDELQANGYDATAVDNGDGTITVTFGEPSNREYEIDANGNITESKPPITLEQAKDNSMLDEPKNSTVTVADGTVTVPAGFKVAEDSGSTLDEGIVITDAPDGEEGNEFVWVPVKNFNEFTREHFGTEAQKWWSGTFVTDGLSENNMYEPTSDGIMEDTEVEKMYKSVKENKGFYVGRYEAGTTASSGTGKRGEVVSKKGANVYNNIGWSDSNDMTDEAGGAVEVARGMYTEEKGDSVTSTLIYGVQWDAIMRWMKDKPNLTSGKYVQDSSNMGWYSDNYTSGNPTHQTGIDLDGGKNKVKNIYDLAGNVFEWTMECFGHSNRVCRGGGYFGSGSEFPISYRSGNEPSDSLPDLGFRITLYLN